MVERAGIFQTSDRVDVAAPSGVFSGVDARSIRAEIGTASAVFYDFGERAHQAASDLVDCLEAGAAIVAVATAVSAPVGGELGAVVAGALGAKCLVEIVSDAVAPNDVNKQVHTSTSMLTPWGFSAGIVTATAGHPGQMFTAAKAANCIVSGLQLGRSPLSDAHTYKHYEDCSEAVQETLDGFSNDSKTRSAEPHPGGAPPKREQPEKKAPKEKEKMVPLKKLADAREAPRESRGRITDDPRETKPGSDRDHVVYA